MIFIPPNVLRSKKSIFYKFKTNLAIIVLNTQNNTFTNCCKRVWKVLKDRLGLVLLRITHKGTLYFSCHRFYDSWKRDILKKD